MQPGEILASQKGMQEDPLPDYPLHHGSNNLFPFPPLKAFPAPGPGGLDLPRTPAGTALDRIHHGLMQISFWPPHLILSPSGIFIHLHHPET
jgi:hypothetical protein